MDPTTLGVVTILVVGLGVLGIAALADWISHRRAEQALRAVPDRGEALADLPAPEYVVGEPTTTGRVLTDDERAELERDLASDHALTVGARLADEALATTSDPARAIVRGALVLVCPDGIGSAREVTGVIGRSARQHTPLVLVAPRFDPQALDVMVQNTLRGHVVALPLRASAEACDRLAEHAGASPVPRSDLQSGYVPDACFGRALLVVAGTGETVMVAEPLGVHS